MPSTPRIFVIDDDVMSREGITSLLEDEGWISPGFSSCEAFLAAYEPRTEACLVLDVHLPGMGGLELLDRLSMHNHLLPVVVVSGDSVISEAVQAMKLGATDFIEKPIDREPLYSCVTRALNLSKAVNSDHILKDAALKHIRSLTPRQREVMDLVLAGNPSKNIALDLGISQRTVENHRASIMLKTGTKSIPALARLAVSAFGGGQDKPVNVSAAFA